MIKYAAKRPLTSIIKYIYVFIILAISQHSWAQSYISELHSKISVADQMKLSKSDEIFNKGLISDTEANMLIDTTKDKTNTSKKYALKRLEADDFYKKAFETKYKVYQSNIKQFWKKYKGDKQLLDYAKKVENASLEPFNKANSLRSQADKKTNLSEKVTILQQAETLENTYITIIQKVLYTYLTWPIEYETDWVMSNKADIPGLKLTTAKDTTNQHKNSIVVTTDSIVKQSVAKRDSIIADSAKIRTVTHSISADSASTKKSIRPIKQAKVDSTNLQTLKSDTVSLVKSIDKEPLPIKYDDVVVGNDSSLYGKVKVNEEQIDQFNSFLKKTYPQNYESYVIDFKRLDYSNINELSDAWHTYLYHSKIQDDASKLKLAMVDTANIDTSSAEGKILLTENRLKNKRLKAKYAQLTSKNTTNKPKGKKNKVIGESIYNQEYIPKSVDSSGFVFRVQIAASRIRLDKNTIAGIYGGIEKIDELFEDKWFKYAIGIYSNYRSARKMRDQLKVPGAFVIAYVNGKRIKITPAIVYKRQIKNEQSAVSNSQSVNYRIQIAASHVPLSESILKSFYTGDLKLDTIQEDGWYKYSFNAGNNYKNAQKLFKTLAIPGSFIVSTSRKNTSN